MITTLTGSNALALSRELKTLTNAFVKKYSDTALERLEGGDITATELQSSMQAGSLFSSNRMLLVSNIANNKQLGEKIDQVLEADNQDVDLVFVEPKFDKRSVLYKTLKKKTILREFNELDEFSLQKWLVDYAKEQGGTIGRTEAQMLLQRVGMDQLRLVHEVDKLVMYDPSVTKETIELLTESTAQSTVFNLLDAAFAGDIRKALKVYDEQRSLRVEPQAILGMIAWQMHTLALVKAAGQRSAEAIASEAKLSPFVVRKTLGLAQKRSMADFKQLVRQTLELDIRLKSQPIDADEALKQLLLEIAN